MLTRGFCISNQNARRTKHNPNSPTRNSAATLELHAADHRPYPKRTRQSRRWADDVIEQILVAILAEGHALIEGVPGTAKTLTVKTFSPHHRRKILADSVHARPDAFGHYGDECFQYAKFTVCPPARSDFYRYFAGG